MHSMLDDDQYQLKHVVLDQKGFSTTSTVSNIKIQRGLHCICWKYKMFEPKCRVCDLAQ